MKATGIVRRIDDLGRVVIPKEIRRTLRIREGDPLEIFTDTDGMVIFKKYSQIHELSDFAGQYAEVLSKAADMPALICDCDHVVAAAGIPRKEILGRRITPEAEEYLLSRVFQQAGAKTAPAGGGRGAPRRRHLPHHRFQRRNGRGDPPAGQSENLSRRDRKQTGPDNGGVSQPSPGAVTDRTRL